MEWAGGMGGATSGKLVVSSYRVWPPILNGATGASDVVEGAAEWVGHGLVVCKLSTGLHVVFSVKQLSGRFVLRVSVRAWEDALFYFFGALGVWGGTRTPFLTRFSWLLLVGGVEYVAVGGGRCRRWAVDESHSS